MELKIYANGTSATPLYTFRAVASCEFVERLTGELTLSFDVPTLSGEVVEVGQVAELDGRYFDIVRVSRAVGDIPSVSAECEHVSYRLNNEEYNLVTFVYTGTVAGGLAEILAGTPFSVGTCKSGTYETAFTDESPLNRRSALIQYAAAVGAEIEYDGWSINLPERRGNATRRELMDGRTVTALSMTADGRAGTESYDIAFYKKFDIEVGDEVHIGYSPLGIDKNTTVIGVAYNPFYTYAARIEVGDYMPNSISAEVTEKQKIRQEFRAANGELLSRIEAQDERFSLIEQDIDSITLKLSGVITKNDLEGYVKTTDLAASIETYINGEEGAAVIDSIVSGTYATKSEIRGFVTSSDVSSSITQQINEFGASLSLTASSNSSTTEEVDIGTYASVTPGEGVTVNGTQYGFSKDSDGYYVSMNSGVDNSFAYGMLRFQNDSGAAKKITIHCVNSGEYNWDFGVISQVNAYLPFSCQQSDFDSADYIINFKEAEGETTAETHIEIPTGSSFITFVYVKDSSNSMENDCLKIKATETVTNYGDAKSTIKLTQDGIVLSSADITFEGMVTFSDLSTAGATLINGANVTTENLTIKHLFFDGDDSQQIIMSSDLDGNTGTIRMGFIQRYGGSSRGRDVVIYADHLYVVPAGGEITDDDVLVISPIDMYFGANSSQWNFDV